MKVLITGGSGFVGMALTKRLLEKNIEVIHLTRQKNSKAGIKTYEWNYKKGYLEQGALRDVTHIVHLAGAGIAEKPWTMSRKREIVKSRVLTARLLFEEAHAQNTPLTKFISASGIGYYGAQTTETIFEEEGNRGDDFVAECCTQWERQANEFSSICQVAIIRTGIVLEKGEGALAKMESSVRRGLGAPLGSGKQYMPWIHMDDIVSIYEKALFDNNFEGTYNAVAGQHVTNETFMRSLASALNKKIRLPRVPAVMLKFVFGELAEILLNGSKVSNKKLTQTGFEFEHDDLDTALKAVYQ